MRPGVCMASADELFFTVTGKGGHAALPQMFVDPVLATSQIIVALHRITSYNVCYTKLLRYGPQSANIEISFKPQYEKGSFPFYLKSLCESKSINLGSADWYIYGVGEGFNNSFDWVENANGMLSLYGYNFDRLMGYAEALKADLEKIV